MEQCCVESAVGQEGAVASVHHRVRDSNKSAAILPLIILYQDRSHQSPSNQQREKKTDGSPDSAHHHYGHRTCPLTQNNSFCPARFFAFLPRQRCACRNNYSSNLHVMAWHGASALRFALAPRCASTKLLPSVDLIAAFCLFKTCLVPSLYLS